MNAPIDIGAGYNQLGEAMQREGLRAVEWHPGFGVFTVTMHNGRTAHGKTIRAAIEATELKVAA